MLKLMYFIAMNELLDSGDNVLHSLARYLESRIESLCSKCWEMKTSLLFSIQSVDLASTWIDLIAKKLLRG